jgi:hypothetical protein
MIIGPLLLWGFMKKLEVCLRGIRVEKDPVTRHKQIKYKLERLLRRASIKRMGKSLNSEALKMRRKGEYFFHLFFP